MPTSALPSISDHPPRDGGGTVTGCRLRRIEYFNPPSLLGKTVGAELEESQSMPTSALLAIPGHPLRAGGGTELRLDTLPSTTFQSTLHVGGGTIPRRGYLGNHRYFNPPSPWGEGPKTQYRPGKRPNFNPPSPWGEGCELAAQIEDGIFISIHPPRGGRDVEHSGAHGQIRNISIHPPRGGRDKVGYVRVSSADQFQSTLPVGGGTPAVSGTRIERGFQSTLPVGGGTSQKSL